VGQVGGTFFETMNPPFAMGRKMPISIMGSTPRRSLHLAGSGRRTATLWSHSFRVDFVEACIQRYAPRAGVCLVSNPGSRSVREFREQYGFTQARLGEMLGTKPATVSHWETGRRPLPAYIAERLQRIRKQLEASPGVAGARTLVIGEARMSDGELRLYPWDARPVTVPAPAPQDGRDWRAVILRDEGRNVEINGWIAYFDLASEIRRNTLAILKLADGIGFCGFLRDAPGGGFAAESFFGERRVDAVEVEACYPVVWLKAPEAGESS
jgi:transcriptional regulator with XRE-family HTH domain